MNYYQYPSLSTFYKYFDLNISSDTPEIALGRPNSYNIDEAFNMVNKKALDNQKNRKLYSDSMVSDLG